MNDIRDADVAATEAFLPLHATKAGEALSMIATLGDQPQLRLLCAGAIIVGLARRDRRLAGTGIRMLLAHEAATAIKMLVKNRVDRRRPRSLGGDPEAAKLRLGNNSAKEESSFPSGHSAGAAAVARAFARSYPEHKGVAYTVAGGLALVQIPRLAHYPSDVGAGLAIGVAAEAVVTRLLCTGA